MEIPGAAHLGCHHAAETRRGLLREDAVIQHHRRVDDASQRRQLLRDRPENPRGVPRAAHIGLHHEHASKFSQRCDRAPGFIGGRSAPAREHDVACAVSQHPLRNLEAEAA